MYLTVVQRFAASIILTLLSTQAAQAASVLRPITFIGGKHPHVTVVLPENGFGLPLYRLHTPRGWVTVRWREDYGTEDGGPALPNPKIEADISHPDTIFNIVIVSPSSLPVYFRGAYGAKWVHVNGYGIPPIVTQEATPNGSTHYTDTHLADPVRMDGGLNIVAIGYPDAE